jgi:hypothetical protein
MSPHDQWPTCLQAYIIVKTNIAPPDKAYQRLHSRPAQYFKREVCFASLAGLSDKLDFMVSLGELPRQCQ